MRDTSPRRLHDLFVTCEAVTPGEYKRRGAGLSLRYGFHPTPFGECLLAVSDRGICNLSFVDGGDREAARADLQSRWLMDDLWKMQLPPHRMSKGPSRRSPADQSIP